MNDGKAIHDAWTEFVRSELAKQLLDGSPSGKYLANRLEAAFISGWEACKRHTDILSVAK